MTALNGRPLDDTYKDLLTISNSNSGITTTRTAIEDGEATTTPLKLSSESYGSDGLVYAELDSASTDLLTSLQAYDTTTINVLCIVKPGTYTTSEWTISNLREIRIGPGVTLKLKGSADAGDALLKITRSDFNLVGSGRTSVLDGNVANQGSTASLRGVFSNGYDRVVVRNVRCTGFSGRGVWLSNGSDLWIDWVWADACGTGGGSEDEALYISRHTSSGDVYNPRITNCRVNGYINIQTDVAGGTVTRGVIALCHIVTTAALQPACEFWGNDDASVIQPLMFGNHAYGGANNIAFSFARTINGLGYGNIAYNYITCFEIAESRYTAFTHGLGNCNGATQDGTHAAAQILNTIDDVTGYENAISDTTLMGFTSFGLWMKGKSGTYTCNNPTAENLRMFASANSVQAVLVEYAPGAKIINLNYRFTGSGCYGITFQNGCTGLQVSGGHYSNGTSPGEHIRVYDCLNIQIDVPTLTHASGTMDTAITLQNVTGRCTGGAMYGTITNACKVRGDGSGKSSARVEVGGWAGDGGTKSINFVTANSGTIGTGNRIRRSDGFIPYNVVGASFSEVGGGSGGTDYTASRWEDGEVTESPNTFSSGVDGSLGSILRDVTNAKLYMLTSATKTWTAQA